MQCGDLSFVQTASTPQQQPARRLEALMTALMAQNIVSLDQLSSITVPQNTRTHHPLPYADAVGYIKAAAQRALGLPIASEEYGTSKDGMQAFAAITLDTGDRDSGLVLGWRGSYNKTLSNMFAAGPQLWVCDNLMIGGDAVKVLRKNTLNVWADFRALVNASIGDSLDHYRRTLSQADAMKAVNLPKERGYAVLGVALGNAVLTPTQANVAFGDWREPRHEEFNQRTLFGLYQAVTEGLKKGAPGRLIDRHVKAHEFFTGVADRLGSGPRPLACLPVAPSAPSL